MTGSTIDKELIRYFALLDQKQKEALLEMIKSFLIPGNSVASQRITIEQYNQALDEAIERMDNGEFITLEDLLKEIENW